MAILVLRRRNTNVMAVGRMLKILDLLLLDFLENGIGRFILTSRVLSVGGGKSRASLVPVRIGTLVLACLVRNENWFARDRQQIVVDNERKGLRDKTNKLHLTLSNRHLKRVLRTWRLPAFRSTIKIRHKPKGVHQQVARRMTPPRLLPQRLITPPTTCKYRRPCPDHRSLFRCL